MDYTEFESLLLSPACTGVIIQVVASGGPAEKADIQPGDTLTHANGTPLRTVRDLVSSLQPIEGEGDVKFDLVAADGRTRSVTLPRGQAGLGGVGVEQGRPAWRDVDDSDYEPDFSIAGREGEIWLGTRFGINPAGYERMRIRPRGEEYEYDHLTWFGGEHEGHEWAYKVRVVSRHLLDRALTTTAIEMVSGTEAEGQTRSVLELDARNVWRGTATDREGATNEVATPVPARAAINTYAVPLLATTLPLEAGARLTVPVITEGDGSVRSRTRLECTGRDRVTVDGVEREAWRFVWAHYGSPNGNEVFWIADDRRLVRIDWGPDYGGCWIEELPRGRVGEGIPDHIRVE